ncbi:MAG: efflux RND transporter periplasmic adaptor subunit [Candidatus Cloacimonetes bacterium]|nr:efflux RND transporter periplasmic adaptor subunit [Candidatus Cloacimonadota bacterium]
MKKIIFILCATLLLTACNMGGKKGKGGELTEIPTYTVKKGAIETKLDITGEVQPVSTIKIKSQISGKIMKFYVDENQFVNIGDVIADIEPDYNQAESISRTRSSLRLAEIRLAKAEKEFNDYTQLYNNNYISMTELSNASDEFESAKINHTQALGQYNLVKDIDTKDSVSKLYATSAGTVISRLVEEGEMVTSSNSGFGEGTVIMLLADLNRMVVNSEVNEVDISKYSMNQVAQVSIDAFPYDKYSGKVSKIAASATNNNGSKVFPIEIYLEGNIKKLKPGMSANVSIKGESREDILIIPIRSIFTDEKGQDVVYLMKDGKAEKAVPIKTGINDFQQVEVINGLSENDVIALTEPAELAPKSEEFEF